MNFKQFIYTFLLLLLSNFAKANEGVEMADQFRADGKIYIVITVFAIVLTGFFAFIFYLDNKLNKLEKEIK